MTSALIDSENLFPRETLRLVETPRRCSYLPWETAAIEHRIFGALDPAPLEQLVRRGWRRFGVDLFRPKCAACTQCRPIRIDVAQFRPSKSQRRSRNHNDQVKVSLHPAEVTERHVELYNAWHVDMAARRGWSLHRIGPLEYADAFLQGEFPSSRELRYFLGEELVGVGLIDLLPRSLSSAYFYHAPTWRPLGPGTFSLLCELELARRLRLEYVYLGYWISKCPSMAYKNRFQPYELLSGRPGDDEEPHWRSQCSGEDGDET